MVKQFSLKTFGFEKNNQRPLCGMMAKVSVSNFSGSLSIRFYRQSLREPMIGIRFAQAACMKWAP